MGAAETLPLWLTLGELEGVTPAGSDAVADCETLELAVSVVEGVDAGVLLLEPVGDPVGVGVGEGAAVTLPDFEALPVALEEAPGDSELVGDALSVLEAESVEEGVGKGEGVALGVGEPVPLEDTVCDGVALLDSEVLPVFDCEAPALSDAVSEPLSVLDEDRVVLGVGAGVPVEEPVEDPVGELEGEGAAEALLLWLTLGVFEGVTPAGSNAVADSETLVLAVSVVGIEGAGVLLLDPMGVPEAGVGAAVALLDSNVLPVALALAPGDSELVGEALRVLEAESVEEGV